jgi:hypothetical protein
VYALPSFPSRHANTRALKLTYSSDIIEEVHQLRARLYDESILAAKYGDGSWAYFRGALYELSRKGMWNRVLLVFVAFALQNMSGAAGKLSNHMNIRDHTVH